MSDDSIFQNPWWSLHVAVAWVLTRDRGFTESTHSRSSKSLLGIELAIVAERNQGTPLDQHFDDVEDAWKHLYASIADGSIRVAGTPFERRRSEASVLETNEARRAISAAEFSSLEFRDWDGEPCLTPSDWRVAHGSDWNNLRGYKDIQVFRDNLMAKFLCSGEHVFKSSHLPPIQPNNVAYMPLFEAAYWIAIEGGSLPINVRDPQAWAPAFHNLLMKIAAGQVEIIGRPNGAGIPESIPARVFASIRVSYPYCDAL
jgi:hypothetical protein